MRSGDAKVLTLLREGGFTLLRYGKHPIWACPCGKHRITTSGTHCEGRGDRNAAALIKRTLRSCATAERKTA